MARDWPQVWMMVRWLYTVLLTQLLLPFLVPPDLRSAKLAIPVPGAISFPPLSVSSTCTSSHGFSFGLVVFCFGNVYHDLNLNCNS